MKPEFLKQSEIFAFIAAILLFNVVFLEKARQENPPIIVLSEEEDSFRFDSGSAKIPPAFLHALNSYIIPLIDSLSQAYNCDAIEVVGHTDEEPLQNPFSNLDYRLLEAAGKGDYHALSPGSNLDLGMMRALSIITALKKSQSAGLLSQIQYFHPYSAGQMIDLDRHLISSPTGGRDARRRRIEIRLLNSATRPLQHI